MKLLFIGDYSGMHATLASEFRRRGHHVTLVSDGGLILGTQTDIKLVRTPGIAGSFRYLYEIFSMLPTLQGYDVVQLINPGFFNLKPGKLRYLFRELKNRNGAIYLSLAGPDHYYVRGCVRGIFPFSDFRVGSELSPFARENRRLEESWLSHRLEDYTNFIYENLDAAISNLYEYHKASEPYLGEKLHYAGLPVNLRLLGEHPFTHDGETHLLVGTRTGREVEKGTDLLLEMARSLEVELRGKLVVEHACDIPWKEYIRRLERNHIVLDQLYALSPALNALQTMALGRVTGSGASQEYYDFIGEPALRPIFELNPTDPAMRDRLRDLVLAPERLQQMAHDGRKLVEKHNDVALVADKYEKVWNLRY